MKLLFSIALAASLNAQQPLPTIPDDLTLEPGVAYAQTDPQQAMDILRLREASTRRPAVLCIHGGGFRAGSRKG